MKKYYIPKTGELVPKRGSWLTSALCRTMLRVTGWKLEGMLPNISKGVFIGAPHTSTWDFPIAITLLFALGIRMSWMGKHTFVDGSLKPLWHYLGGIPIDRRAPHGVVGEMVKQFNGRSTLWLGLAPEGTRSKVKQWRLGFYYIARDANVPICPILLDYGRKVIQFGPPIEADEDIEVVFDKLRAFYKGAIARHPQNFILIKSD